MKFSACAEDCVAHCYYLKSDVGCWEQCKTQVV